MVVKIYLRLNSKLVNKRFTTKSLASFAKWKMIHKFKENDMKKNQTKTKIIIIHTFQFGCATLESVSQLEIFGVYSYGWYSFLRHILCRKWLKRKKSHVDTEKKNHMHCEFFYQWLNAFFSYSSNNLCVK